MRAALTALPQGPSLRTRFCCPGPSSLTRPHPPHSRAHRDFACSTYTRCLRCAVAEATHEWFRAFAPRSVLGMPSSTDPGELTGDFCPTTSPTTLAFAPSRRARRSQRSHHPLQVGPLFRGFLVHSFVTACRVVSLLGGSDRVSPAAETCTSGLSTRRSPFTSPDRTTVALGHLHWRDFHPLERQLASLHLDEWGRLKGGRPGCHASQ